MRDGFSVVALCDVLCVQGLDSDEQACDWCWVHHTIQWLLVVEAQCFVCNRRVTLGNGADIAQPGNGLGGYSPRQDCVRATGVRALFCKQPASKRGEGRSTHVHGCPRSTFKSCDV